MKSNSYLTCGLLLFLSMSASNCSDRSATNNMGMLPDLGATSVASLVQGIGSGDMEVLMRFLSPEFKLAVPDSSYRTPDASKALQEFYRENKPLSFEELHRGASKTGDGQYLVGNLRTDNGLFRTNIVLRKGQVVELKFSRPTH